MSANQLGLAREAQVAVLTGGTVVRQQVLVQGLGRTEIDVVGKAGEYIAVGGPAKALNPGDLGRKLQIMKRAADEAKVKAVAYFAEGTPESVLKIARKHLGKENVHTFKDVAK